MKTIYSILIMLLLSPIGFTQEEIETDPDTTRMKIGNTTIILIENNGEEETIITDDFDTVDWGSDDPDRDD